MKEDTTVIPFRQSDSLEDALTEIAREGARRMLAEALKAEADAFVASLAGDLLPDGRRRVVRHGYGPERSVQTGIGAIDVRRPKSLPLTRSGGSQFTSLEFTQVLKDTEVKISMDGRGRWIDYYNEERPHSGIAGLTPSEAYRTGCGEEKLAA